MTKLPKSGQIVLRTIYEMNDTITKVVMYNYANTIDVVILISMH